jgi:hypothetical protein
MSQVFRGLPQSLQVTRGQCLNETTSPSFQIFSTSSCINQPTIPTPYSLHTDRAVKQITRQDHEYETAEMRY